MKRTSGIYNNKPGTFKNYLLIVIKRWNNCNEETGLREPLLKSWGVLVCYVLNFELIVAL